jgi:endogenous inhibitor of DNA gyrase (YacG/DUF329 family)
MADTLKTFDVTCPECGEEFEADIPESALLPEVDRYSIDCPECGASSLEIVYDGTAQTVTLIDTEMIEADDEDEGDEDEEEQVDDAD